MDTGVCCFIDVPMAAMFLILAKQLTVWAAVFAKAENVAGL